MTHRAAIFPAGRHGLSAAHRHSAAIRSGDLLFVSGQAGSEADGARVAAHAGQVRQAFANLQAVLAAAGAALEDIPGVTTFHTDPAARFGAFLAIQDEVFPTAPDPAWTALGVNRLAGFDVEIKAIARLPVTGRNPPHSTLRSAESL